MIGVEGEIALADKTKHLASSVIGYQAYSTARREGTPILGFIAAAYQLAMPAFVRSASYEMSAPPSFTVPSERLVVALGAVMADVLSNYFIISQLGQAGSAAMVSARLGFNVLENLVMDPVLDWLKGKVDKSWNSWNPEFFQLRREYLPLSPGALIESRRVLPHRNRPRKAQESTSSPKKDRTPDKTQDLPTPRKKGRSKSARFVFTKALAPREIFAPVVPPVEPIELDSEDWIIQDPSKYTSSYALPRNAATLEEIDAKIAASKQEVKPPEMDWSDLPMINRHSNFAEIKDDKLRMDLEDIADRLPPIDRFPMSLEDAVTLALSVCDISPLFKPQLVKFLIEQQTIPIKEAQIKNAAFSAIEEGSIIVLVSIAHYAKLHRSVGLQEKGTPQLDWNTFAEQAKTKLGNHDLNHYIRISEQTS